jgi:hypothetical protein
MTLSRYERETIINFNEEETECNIYTRSKAVKNKIEKLVKKFPDIYKVDEIFEDEGIAFTCDKKYISIRAPRNRHRE